MNSSLKQASQGVRHVPSLGENCQALGCTRAWRSLCTCCSCQEAFHKPGRLGLRINDGLGSAGLGTPLRAYMDWPAFRVSGRLGWCNRSPDRR